MGAQNSMREESDRGGRTPVRVRFAPSPTGVLHVGGARTALFNFLFARKQGGTFVLRIEDTDRERSKKEFEEDIFDGLAWLSISHDELYRQSERTAVYATHVDLLIAQGKAYVSSEEVRGEVAEGKRSEVIRFKNPRTTVTFTDLIRGDISFDTTELGDFVIAKDRETPLYNLAAVIDDFEMGITHVIRGEDGISNTPRQILIQEAIGAPRPHYAHIPFILAPDRSKLSKRHGAVSVTEYRRDGFLPEAMVNFLALVGWNPGGERELYTLQELIEVFSLNNVQRGGAVFNIEKLRWMNREYLKALSDEELLRRAEPLLPPSVTSLEGFSREAFARALAVLRDRLHTIGDVAALAAQGEFNYFFTAPGYDRTGLLWKQERDFAKTKTRLLRVAQIIDAIDPASFSYDSIGGNVLPYADKEGRGNVLWPMRYALSGRDRSPDPITLASVLGREETLRRLRAAAEKCDA